MNGLSLIIHKTKNGWFIHCGKYVKGIFSDNNALYNPDKKSGFGLKLDLPIGPLADPMSYLFKKETWTEKPLIRDIPLDEWDTFFGEDLAKRLRDKLPNGHEPKEVHDFKYAAYNPWKGKYWFRIYLKWFIGPFIAIATPWFSSYYGFKTFNLEPEAPNSNLDVDQGDYTWAYDLPAGRYMCPSSSTRKERS